jgi:hypothetical protein
LLVPHTIPVDASDNLVNDDYFAQAVNIKSIKEHGTTPHLPQGPEKTADSTAALL